MGHRRSRQGEKAGCFTDADGYKRQPDNTGTWESGRGSGQLLPPTSRWPTEAHGAYTLEGNRQEYLILAKAVAEKWPVPEATRNLLIEKMSALLEADPEIAVAAARTLVMCEKQNLDARKRKQAASARVQIQNILATSVEPPAPDPDYVRWKQQQLLEQSQGIVTPVPTQPSGGDPPESDRPDEPVALLPGGVPQAPVGQLSQVPAPLTRAVIQRRTRLLM